MGLLYFLSRVIDVLDALEPSVGVDKSPPIAEEASCGASTPALPLLSAPKLADDVMPPERVCAVSPEACASPEEAA
ncbi:hypothetical protein PF003_g23273 [Phytophthora fragariae]|nr:hypothetical protein PF003_g23273 [Phytophthora fragariae]